MKPTRPERDHKNRWCFRCETWGDMEPWSTSWGGCRCPTCQYVAKVSNQFFETVKCSVCGRLCEGVTDDKGRLGCSYECAYKIGHVTRDIMMQYAGRKWQSARSDQDAPIIRATEPAPTTYTTGETEWANRIAVAEQRFVDEYDARKAAEREIVELKARIAVLEAMKP